jgi:hypothetical protein
VAKPVKLETPVDDPDDDTPQEPTQAPEPVALFTGPNSFEAVLAEYGVTESDLYAPPVATAQKTNIRDLCVVTTQVLDDRGQPIQNVRGHTGPLVFLAKQGEYDGDRFSGYDGFYVFAALHPKKGKVILTIGRRKDDDQSVVVSFMNTLKKGAMFQIAEINTSHGYGVYTPVPVQR